MRWRWRVVFPVLLTCLAVQSSVAHGLVAQADCTPAQARTSAVAAARQDVGRRLASAASLYRDRFRQPAYSLRTGRVSLAGRAATVAGQMMLSGTSLQTGKREQVNFSGLLLLTRPNPGTCQWRVTGYRRE